MARFFKQLSLSVFLVFLTMYCTSVDRNKADQIDRSDEVQLELVELSRFALDLPGITLNRSRDVAVLNHDETMIAWIDDGKNQIIITDLEGNYINHFGSRGSGPKEFGRISALGFTEDNHLVAYDSRQGLFKLFDIDGNILNTTDGLHKDGLFLRAHRIYNKDNYIYLGVQERARSRPDNHWTSRIIAKYDLNGDLIKLFGEYDPDLVGTEPLYQYGNITYDKWNHTFFTSHRTSPYIQKTSDDANETMARFGVLSENFNIPDDRARVSDPIHIRRQKNLDQNFVGNSFVTKDYFLFHHFNWTEEYFQLLDLNLKPSFLNVYSKEAPHAFLGELQLNYTPLLATSDNVLFVLIDDNPENFTIGTYEISVQ